MSLPGYIGLFYRTDSYKQSDRVFKERIYKTNHNRPERDLLQYINMQMTARFLILGGFQNQDPELTAQIRRLQQTCPDVLDRLLPHRERDHAAIMALGEDDDTSAEPEPIRGFQVNSEPGHVAVKVRMMLSVKFVREALSLPTRGEHMPQKLSIGVTTAFEQDLRIPAVSAFRQVRIKWWKEISYTG